VGSRSLLEIVRASITRSTPPFDFLKSRRREVGIMKLLSDLQGVHLHA